MMWVCIRLLRMCLASKNMYMHHDMAISWMNYAQVDWKLHVDAIRPLV
jgi:hypothetical protein